MWLESNKSESEIIDNYKLEQLYNHEIENSRFFKVVFESENETKIQLSSKTYMQIKFLPSRNDIEGIEIKKLVGKEIRQKISFSKFNFEQLQLFLQFIDDIDLKTISERRLKLSDNSLDVLDTETKKKITTLLHGSEGAELIKNLLENEIVTSQDIVNTGYRKNQLKIFRKLLNEKDYLEQYKTEESEIQQKIKLAKENGINLNENTKEELVWQYYFAKNPWIFGYGLNYRFKNILQKEFSASDTDAAGKEQVNGDFLIGDDYYTTFVELKKPTTNIFVKNKSGKNRSGSWKISNDLIYAISQILEQKAVGQIKLEKEPFDEDGNRIKQKGYDSKCILILGNLKDELSLSEDSEKTREIKKKTFELYRRDSRNIEIITYDELYNRAKYICQKG